MNLVNGIENGVRLGIVFKSICWKVIFILIVKKKFLIIDRVKKEVWFEVFGGYVCIFII